MEDDSRIRCFMLEETDRIEIALRRLTLGDVHACNGSAHWARVVIGFISKSVVQTKEGYLRALKWDHADERWPAKCERCAYLFQDEDYWDVDLDMIYRRAENGAEYMLRQAPPGAMWYANWMGELFVPQDARGILCVRMPGNFDWCIDGQANNCTKPGDRTHHCWIREGVAPDVTAGKNGNTCSAGAGSIQVPGWHGFLTKGYLVKS